MHRGHPHAVSPVSGSSGRRVSYPINVVDPFTRKGFRFKGRARIVEAGPELDEIIAFYRKRNVTSPIRAAVLV